MSSHKNQFAHIASRLAARENLLFIVGLILAVILRLSLFDFESVDYKLFLSSWYDYIRAHGGFRALKDDFSYYTPSYLYLLTIATYLPIPKLYAIKLISVIFDFPLAVIVLLFVRLKYENKFLWVLSFFITLFTPTVFFNSAMWGQCDAIYTAALLASIYCVIKKRPVASMIFLGVALSFKQQAVFLLPLFLVLYLKRELSLKVFLLIPAVYILSILPAWLMGRPFIDLLMIHIKHAQIYDALTLNAPNLYQWMPREPRLAKAAIFFALSCVFLFCFVVYQSKVELEKNRIVRLSLVSLILMPFTLPHMHERYFFPADVLSIIYAFYFPRFFFIPILVISASFFSYFAFIFNDKVHFVALLFFNDLRFVLLPFLAVLMTIALIITVIDLVKSLYPDLRRGNLTPDSPAAT